MVAVSLADQGWTSPRDWWEGHWQHCDSEPTSPVHGPVIAHKQVQMWYVCMLYARVLEHQLTLAVIFDGAPWIE